MATWQMRLATRADKLARKAERIGIGADERGAPHNARRSTGRATLQGGPLGVTLQGGDKGFVRQNSDVRLGEGETFYAPWEHDGKLFILKKGRMRLYRSEGGREFTLEVVDAGTVFGEMAFTPHRLRES
jgi:hypothetical protein